MQIGYASVGSPIFLLPDCFYTNAVAITRLSMSGLIIQGPSRLPSALTLLEMDGCILEDASGNAYDLVWSTLFASFSSLNTFSATTMKLNGSLPTALPSGLSSFTVNTNLLSGTIPSTLFSNVGSSETVVFAAYGNRLTGSIPSALFASATSALEVSLDLQFNRLTGSLPTNLFGSLTNSLKTINLKLSNNQLSGTIPGGFLISSSSASTRFYEVFISMNYNSLTGVFPSTFFGSYLNSVYYMAFSASNNVMTGSLPSAFFGSTSFMSNSSLSLDFTNNGLTGSLPSALFSKSVPNALVLQLSYNSLSGSIPSTFFSAANLTSVKSIILYLDHNKLTGGLPSGGLFSASNAPILSNMALYMDGNTFSGSVPASFLSSLSSTTTSTTSSGTTTTSNVPALTLTISASSGSLSGTLSLPDLSARAAIGLQLSLTLSSNAFTSLNINPAAGLYVTTLSVSSNTKMTGTLPSAIFNASSTISRFQAANTALSGDMPDMQTLNSSLLSSIDLSSTNIEFCAEPRAAWNTTGLTSCSLTSTTAYNCTDLYPSNCVITAIQPSTPTPVATTTPEGDAQRVIFSLAFIALSSILVITIL